MTEKRIEGWAQWEPCDRDAPSEALARLAAELPRFFGAATLVAGRQAALSFYESLRLMELTFERDGGLARAFVLHGPEHTFWLSGEAAPIHTANELEPLALTDASVADYLRFFLYFLRADGAFLLLESPEEIEPGSESGTALVLGSDNDTLPLEEVRKLAVPLAARGVEDGRWLFDGTVAYDGAVFRASFAVATDGIVEMTGDEPVGLLGSTSVPDAPVLTLVERRNHDAQSDREITEAVVSVLLEDALRTMNSSPRDATMLLRHFNGTRDGAAIAPIDQLSLIVEGSKPVVIIESDIPFIEDFVATLVASDRARSATTGRPNPMVDNDLRCELSVSEGAGMYLLSFHTYRSVYDAERLAHDLSVADASVFIGCGQSADVPEALRRICDLVIPFPRIDRTCFRRIFERVFHADLNEGWETPGVDWTRYLVPADFHPPRRLGLKPADALQFLRERVEQRLREVTPDVGLRLSDLHGMGEARQIAEDLIADVQAAQSGDLPMSSVDRGLLLVGAPGTGKTTLGRAIAKECGIKFVVSSAASWQSAGHLGDYLRAMRADFNEARRYAPSILFIDEIDSIGSRELVSGDNAQYHTEVINALLEQIQGINTSALVIVIGATNYPEKVDPALRRAGRLDQVVEIPLPNIDGMEQILNHHLAEFRANGGKVGSDVVTRVLAELAFGLTGADAEFFVRGAARRARRANRALSQEDLLAEVTRRPRRPDSARRLGPEVMRRVAVHEAGHAVANLLSSTQGRFVSFASIIPRNDGSLGFVARIPSDSAVMTRQTMMEELEAFLAGRAAEEVVFGVDNVGGGAGGPEGSDLEVATSFATRIVCRSGLGGGGLRWSTTPTSEQARQIDDLLSQSYRGIVTRLQSRRDLLDRIAEALVQKQELSGDELRRLAAQSAR